MYIIAIIDSSKWKYWDRLPCTIWQYCLILISKYCDVPSVVQCFNQCQCIINFLQVSSVFVWNFSGECEYWTCLYKLHEMRIIQCFNWIALWKWFTINVWWGIFHDVIYLISFVFLIIHIIQVPPWSASLFPWQFEVNLGSLWLWCIWGAFCFPCHHAIWYFLSLREFFFRLWCSVPLSAFVFWIYWSSFNSFFAAVSHISFITCLMQILSHFAQGSGCTDPPCVCGVDSSGSWILSQCMTILICAPSILLSARCREIPMLRCLPWNFHLVYL